MGTVIIMTFRKDSLLFYQSKIIYIIMAISCLILFPILRVELWLSALFALYFVILTLINPKLHNEFITINEIGISCQQSGKQLWAYEWDCIAKLKRSSRFRMPSIEVITYNKRGEAEQFALPDQYFQLGKAAKEAIMRYYKPTEHSLKQ